MVTFREQLELDLEVVFNPDEFAENAVYQPLTGDSKPVVVIIERGNSLQDMARGNMPASVGTVKMKKSEISTPKTHEKIIAGSSGDEEWELLDEISSDFLTISMSAVKNTRTRKH
ncbi:MAG: hypothetical protein HQM10_26535 [Candidatus Riflebacteria bacterium]|nr:hypothetical protein [Candidatus Riflebacteria bacterium]